MIYKNQYRTQYLNQKSHCKRRKDRLGNQILMLLTFEEWLDIWTKSGHLHERGNKRGQWCMARNNDLGHYEIGNVSIIPTTENCRNTHFWFKQARGKIRPSEQIENVKTGILKTKDEDPEKWKNHLKNMSAGIIKAFSTVEAKEKIKKRRKDKIMKCKYIFSTPRGIFINTDDLFSAYSEYKPNTVISWCRLKRHNCSMKLKVSSQP